MKRRGDAGVLSEGHFFLEAPRWHDGGLYASDIYGGSVLRWPGDGGAPETVHRLGTCPSGLGWDREGRLMVVSMEDRKLLVADDDGLLEVADLSRLAPWHLNDMLVDAEGRAYVGNLGWDDEHDRRIASTILIRVDPDGSARAVAEELVNPNGMALTPDGRTLLVAETFAARITAFTVDAGGGLSERRVWARFGEGGYETMDDAYAEGALLPDGIALDRKGGLWVGDCRGRGASRVLEGGRVTDHVDTGEHATFAVALGGAGGRTLFLCTGPAFETADHRTSRAAAMCALDVEVPAAAWP